MRSPTWNPHTAIGIPPPQSESPYRNRNSHIAIGIPTMQSQSPQRNRKKWAQTDWVQNPVNPVPFILVIPSLIKAGFNPWLSAITMRGISNKDEIFLMINQRSRSSIDIWYLQYKSSQLWLDTFGEMFFDNKWHSMIW